MNLRHALRHQDNVSRRAWAFERGTLWVAELDGEIASPVLPNLEAGFGEVRRESAELLAAAMGLPNPEPVVQRFAAGRRCFAAWVADRIAAYGWVSQGVECIGELERKIHMSPGEAYIWDCVTLQPYRRRRLYSALLSHVLVALRREGVQRAWIGSSLDNRPSIRGFANAGFQPVITLLYARLFNLRCVWMIGHRAAPGPLVAAARRALTTEHERVWGVVAVGRSNPVRFPECIQIEG